ncbi:thiocillin family RiPP [Streptomyces sp. NBC_01278]|uniref:thiocillin family RiPP n=1 Tax=Streptomyces sp. NBC_01278 TaxID=2903809 RepID=UPI002E2F1207|nr:thiocillin family RiPP [Streptomyces sp. NBC_01278]
MDHLTDLDLIMAAEGPSGAFLEDLQDSAAAYSTIGSVSTAGTATGCASSFGSAGTFG